MPDLAELQVVVREKGVTELRASLDKLERAAQFAERAVKHLHNSVTRELNAAATRGASSNAQFSRSLEGIKRSAENSVAGVKHAAQALEQYGKSAMRAQQSALDAARKMAEAQRWFAQSMSLKGPGIGVGAAFAGLSPQFERAVQSAMSFGRELAALQTRFSGLSTGTKAFTAQQYDLAAALGRTVDQTKKLTTETNALSSAYRHAEKFSAGLTAGYTKASGQGRVFAAQQYDLAAALNRSVDPTKSLAVSSNNLGGAYGHLKAQTKELPASLRQNAREMANLTQQSRHAGMSVGNLRRGFYDLRNLLVILGIAKVTQEFGKFAQFIVKTGMEMERLKIAMTGLMGSQTGGAVAMDWMRKFAIETPYNIEQSMRAFMLLKAYGLDPMNGALQTAADLAARFGGDAERFHYIALAMGQMSAHQRILSREMLQFSERGVPAWQWLAEALNRLHPEMKLTTSQLREMVAESKLGQEAVTALFDIMAEKAKGASEILMQTLWGKLQKIGDMMRFMAMDLTEGGLFTGLKTQVDALADALTVLTTSGATARWGMEIGQALRGVNISATSLASGMIGLGDSFTAFSVEAVELGGTAIPLLGGALMRMIQFLGDAAAAVNVILHPMDALAEKIDKIIEVWYRAGGTEAFLGDRMGPFITAWGDVTRERAGAGEQQQSQQQMMLFQKYIKELGLDLDALKAKYGDIAGVWKYASENVGVLTEKEDKLVVAMKAVGYAMQGIKPDLKVVADMMFQGQQAAAEYAESLRLQLEEALGATKAKLGPLGEQFQDVLVPALRDAGQSVSEFLQSGKELRELGLIDLDTLDDIYTLGTRIDELTTKLQEMIRVKAPEADFAKFRTEVEAILKASQNLAKSNLSLGSPSTQAALKVFEDNLKAIAAEEKKAADYAGEHGKAVRQLMVSFEDLNPAFEDMIEFIEALESKTGDSVLTWREFQQAVKAAVDTGQGLEAMREQVARLAEVFRYLAEFQTPEFAMMFNTFASFFEGMLPGLDRAVIEIAQELSAKFAEEMNRGIADVFGNSFKALIEGRFESLSDFLSDLFANLAGTVVDRFVKEMIDGLMGGGGKDSKGGIAAAFGRYTDWIEQNRGMAALAGASMVYSGYQQAQGGNRMAGVLSGALGGAQAGYAFSPTGPWGAIIGAIVGAAIAYFGSQSESPETRIRVMAGGATSVETRGGQGYSYEMRHQASLEIRQSYRAIFRAYLEAVRAFRMGDLTDLLSGELPSWRSGAASTEGWGGGGVQAFQSWLTEVQFPQMFQSYFGNALREGLERLGMSFAATSRLFRELSEMTGAERMAALLEFIGTLRTAVDSLADLARPIEEVVGANTMEQYSYQLQQMGESLDAMFIGWDQMNLLEQGQMLGQINTLVMQAREAELQMLQQIHNLQEQVTAAFESAAESLAIAQMTPGEQIQYGLNRIARSRAIISNPLSAPEDVQAAAAEIIRWVQFVRQVLESLGISMSDTFADIGAIFAAAAVTGYDLTEDLRTLNDVLASLSEPIDLNVSAMEEYTSQLEDWGAQIDELMETLDVDDLEASARSAREIGDLVRQAREAEIAMLRQIDSIQRSVTDSLRQAIESYQVEQMTPQEKVNYFYNQIEEDFRRIAAARSPEEVQTATNELISDIGSLDRVLRELGFDASSLLGDIFRPDGRFNPNQTLGDWFSEMLGRGQTMADIVFERLQQEVSDRFQPFYDAMTEATTFLQGLADAAERAANYPWWPGEEGYVNESGVPQWAIDLFGGLGDLSFGDWLTGILDDAAVAATTAFDAMSAAVIAQFQPFWDALLVATYWVEHFGEAVHGLVRDEGDFTDGDGDDGGGGTRRPGEGTFGRDIGKSLLGLGQQQTDNIARLVTALEGTVIQPVIYVTVVGGGVRSVTARTAGTYLTKAPIA